VSELVGGQSGHAIWNGASWTYLETGFAPVSGGALGRYRTRGYSGSDVDVGSHPNNVGRRFNPMDTKSSEVAGIGGNFW
jgi:hypothetical protein